jgi:undecaprenyl-diphosphatase
MSNYLLSAEAIQRFDQNTLLRISGPRRSRDWSVRAARVFTRLGDTDMTIAHVLLLASLAPAGQRLSTLITIGSSVLNATLLSQAIKRTVRRQRPSVTIPGFSSTGELPDAYSFPSGHTSAAMALATAALTVNPILGEAELALALAIGLSRIRLGAHYPIDVFAGALLGVITAAGWLKLVGPLIG